MKFVNGSNFKKFKNYFKAEYVSGFVVPADTFDNVKGNFPIGFTVWNTAKKSNVNVIKTDIFDKTGEFNGVKNFYGDFAKGINQWISKFQDKGNQQIGFLDCSSPDFQNQNYVFIDNLENDKNDHRFHLYLTKLNLLTGFVYFSVRHCFEANWLNDRDQFIYPNENWIMDAEFQNDCLAFSVFNGQNRISSIKGANHWIPFKEQEVNAKEKFASNYMTDFIAGKLKMEENTEATLFNDEVSIKNNFPLQFSDEAKAVFDAGRELWKYYHSQKDINVNSSFYDIREFFQGRNEKTGRMNNKSTDEKYTELIADLRLRQNILADKIKPKIYEYEFLKD